MPNDQYRINSQTDIYYMTFTVIDWMDVFTRPAYKNVIVDSLNHCVRHKGLEVYAWCLMTNHMHIIMRAMGDTRMSDILRDFKGYTAKQILALMEQPGESRGKQMLNQMAFRGKPLSRITKYKFWDDTNHAIAIYSHEFMMQKLEYIHQNPVRAMIVDRPEDYIFSSARDYAGIKGLVDVVRVY